MELYKKYRPKTLDEVVGQPEAVGVLSKLLKKKEVPHTLLLSGPSGVGKTTIARILRDELDCSETDFCEINAANERGIDKVRDIDGKMRLSPLMGSCRIYLYDECHRLTSDAQTALLKMLEDTPPHVYFFLCTTDPKELLPTIRSRCTEVKLRSLTHKEVCTVVRDVISIETGEPEGDLGEVIEKIAELAGGGARKALVLLHQVWNLGSIEEQLEALQKADTEKAAVDLARALVDGGNTWKQVAAILKGLADEDPEQIRRAVLGYATAVLLGGGKKADRAYTVIQAMEDSYFSGGRASLVADCWELAGPRK